MRHLTQLSGSACCLRWRILRKLTRMTFQVAPEAGKIPEFSKNDRLRKAREIAGISQEEMAAAIGISRRSLSRYENHGGVPRSATLLYSLRSGVPIEWIETGHAPESVGEPQNPGPGGGGSGRPLRYLVEPPVGIEPTTFSLENPEFEGDGERLRPAA